MEDLIIPLWWSGGNRGCGDIEVLEVRKESCDVRNGLVTIIITRFTRSKGEMGELGKGVVGGVGLGG